MNYDYTILAVETCKVCLLCCIVYRTCTNCYKYFHLNECNLNMFFYDKHSLFTFSLHVIVVFDVVLIMFVLLFSFFVTYCFGDVFLVSPKLTCEFYNHFVQFYRCNYNDEQSQVIIEQTHKFQVLITIMAELSCPLQSSYQYQS